MPPVGLHGNVTVGCETIPESGNPVRFVATPEAGVPSAGVTSVGEVAKTFEPVPVEVVRADKRFAEDGVARKVATPVARPDTPVEIGRPVALVRTAADGVPRAGVKSVGEVASTIAPVPVVVAAISCFDEFVATATALVGTTAPLTPTTVCELLVPERSPPAVKPLPAAALRTLPLNDRPVPSVIAEGDAELPLEFPNSVEGA